VSKDHLFSALCGDWARMLDALPESEVHHAVSGFCEWLAQAHDLQKQEMRQARRLEDALKQVRQAWAPSNSCVPRIVSTIKVTCTPFFFFFFFCQKLGVASNLARVLCLS